MEKFERRLHRISCFVVDVGKDSPKLDDILVAQEFPDVYSEKLPGVPPE